MSVRGLIKERMLFLTKKGQKAYEEKDDNTFVECKMKYEELDWLLKKLRK